MINRNRNRTLATVIAMIMIASIAVSSVSSATISADHEVAPSIESDRDLGVTAATIDMAVKIGEINPDEIRAFISEQPRSLRGTGFYSSVSPDGTQVRADSRQTRNSGRSNYYRPVFLSFEEEIVAEGIFHHKFVFGVTDGKFAIHRVAAMNGMADEWSFWIPGSSLCFESNYLVNSSDPEYVSPAVLMAQSGIEVWGISPRYSFVPENETNFTFMKKWDESVFMKDNNFAYSVIEIYNGMMEFVYGDPIPLIVGGHSQGARHAAIIAAERNPDGFISLDMPGSLDPERDADIIAMAKIAFDTLEAERANGTYHDASMAGFKQMFQFADNQTILYALIYTKDLGGFAYYQGYCTGDMEQGLYFTNLSTMAKMTEMASPYQPNSLNLAIYGQWAEIPEYQIPYDQIGCSVFNGEAGFGTGDRCDQAAKEIMQGGNLDVSTVRSESSSHADLVSANNPRFWKRHVIPWMKSIGEE